MNIINFVFFGPHFWKLFIAFPRTTETLKVYKLPGSKF